MLAELIWWARRKRTAFLGVKHVSADGALEDHPHDFEMPDFIAGEEVRLRRLEKQRLAGDLARPTKSATSRSTEVVAQRLTQPQKVIDAAAELRKANTQAELCRIQRRLADVESASSDAKAGLGPKLLHVNKWVKAQAEEQR
ncbi:SWEET14, partial [Symbiodinium necroappetens]